MAERQGPRSGGRVRRERPSEHVEAEVTLDVPEAWPFPDLAGLADDAGPAGPAGPLAAEGVVAVGEPVEHVLDARYVDTPDLRLLRARTTLRRRSGGADAGWHLKLPRPDGDRTEVHLPLRGPSLRPPRELSSLLRATTRGAPLGPVARLRTTRVVRPLLGAPGPDGAPVVLAEVADDTVTAEAPGPAPGAPVEVTTWREVEVELVSGDRSVLEAAVAALVAAGARRSPSPSKLRRVLGDRLPPPPPALPEPTPKGPAADLLVEHLTRHLGRLLAADVPVRRGEAGAVREMGAAARCLASALATFRPLLHEEVTDPVREEVVRLARVLGAAEAAERRCERLEQALRAPGPEPVPGALRERLVQQLGTGVADARAAVAAALEDERHVALLDAVDSLLADAPLTERAAERAKDVLPGRVARDHRGLVDAVDAADGAWDAEQRGALLREARAAAERARCSAAALEPVAGPDAAAYAAAVGAVQEALDSLDDGAEARAVLRAAVAGATPQEAFALGRLHAGQEQRDEHAEAAFEQAWHAATRKRLRRWMR